MKIWTLGAGFVAGFLYGKDIKQRLYNGLLVMLGIILIMLAYVSE